MLNCFARRFYSFASKIPSISPNYLSHPELVSTDESCVGISRSEFEKRRKDLLDLMEEGSVMFLQSPPIYYISDGVMNSWRQSSNLYYLTGCCEPSSALLLSKDRDGNTSERFFVNEGQGDLLLTNSMGVDQSKQIYGVNNTHLISEFEEMWNFEMSPYTMFNPETGQNEFLRPPIFYEENMNDKSSSSSSSPEKSKTNNQSANDLINSLRKIKSEQEIEMIKNSMDITTTSFNNTLQNHLPHCTNEHELETFLEMELKINGSIKGSSFIPVIASGMNSTFIHYIYNNQPMNDGELVIVDAGADYYMYMTDVTRTWPVNGIFSSPQKDVYEAVLNTNKQIIDLFINNNIDDYPKTSNDLDRLSIELLVQNCIEKGIFQNDNVLECMQQWNLFQPHSVSHFIGIDIHEEEQHILSSKNKSVFEPGIMFTVEPGLYFSPDIDYSELGVDEKYLGIGVRIEDDILIHHDGSIEILSINIPKEVEEIEEMYGMSKI